MSPLVTLGQIAPAIDAARSIASLGTTALIVLVAIGLGVLLWYREGQWTKRELKVAEREAEHRKELADAHKREYDLQEARRSDTERLYGRAAEDGEKFRDASVGLSASIDAVPDMVRAQSEATRALVTAESERTRNSVTAAVTSVVDHARTLHDGTRDHVGKEIDRSSALRGPSKVR